MEVYPPEDPAPGEVSQLEQMRAWDASLTQLERVIQEACETEEVHPNVNNFSRELTVTPVSTSGASSVKQDAKRKFEEHDADDAEAFRSKTVRTNEMLPTSTHETTIDAGAVSSGCDILDSTFDTLADIVPPESESKAEMTVSENKMKETDNENESLEIKHPTTSFDEVGTKIFPNSPEHKSDNKDDINFEDSKTDIKDLNLVDNKENIDFVDCKNDNSAVDSKDNLNLGDCKNVNIKCEINEEVKDIETSIDSKDHDLTSNKDQEPCLLNNSEVLGDKEVTSSTTENVCNDSVENAENLTSDKKLKDKKKKKDDDSSESSKNSKKDDKQGKKKKFERCNIRDIKLEDDLDEVTLAAQKEEQERIRRIQEAHMRALQERLQQIEDEKEVLTQLFSQPPPEASHLFDSNPEGNAETSDDSSTKPEVPLVRNENDVILLDNSENSKKAELQDLIVPPSAENVIDISSSSSDSDSECDDDDDELGKKDDDIMVLSDEGDAEPEEANDPNNSGAHTNDCFNLPDMEGRVLVNVGHPPEDPDIFLAPQIAKVIKPHQIGGIRFLYDNVVENLERYKSSSGFGCILAHSMGLGKTVQVVSFVDVFLRHTPATLVLCIVPINTIQNWKAEFDMWVPSSSNVDEALVESGEVRPRDYNVYTLNENFKTMAGRSTLIAEWRKQGGVLLMGYEMYRMLALRKMPKVPVKKSKRQKKLEANVEPETNEQIKKFMDQMYEHIVIPGPDLVICDEGHRIKNSLASTSMALKSIKTRRRVVLTGYPLQNNLLEYWCMVDFVRPNYLGSRAEFCNMFERPISNGQCTDSTPRDRQLMRFRSHVLHSLLVGFVQRRGHSVLRAVLPKKEEHVLLIRMTPIQRKLYKCFVKDLLYVQQATNPLKLFAVCCKIWNHPDILYKLLQEKKAHEDIDLDIDLSTLAPGSAVPGTNSVLKRKGVTMFKDQKSKAVQRPIRMTPQPAKIQPKNLKQLALLPPPSPQSQGQLLPIKIEPQQLCGDQASPDGQNCKHMQEQMQYSQQHSNPVSMQEFSSVLHSQSKSPHLTQQQSQFHQQQHLDYPHTAQHEFTQQSPQTFQQSQYASSTGSQQQFCQQKYPQPAAQQQYQQPSQKCQSHYHQQQFTSQSNTQPSPPSQYSQQPLLQQQFPSQSQSLNTQQQQQQQPFSPSSSVPQQPYLQLPAQPQQQYSPSTTAPQQSSVQSQQQFSQQPFSPQSVTPSPQQFSQQPSGQSPQQFPQSPAAPQHQPAAQTQQHYPQPTSQSYTIQSSAQQESQFHPQSPTQHQHFSGQSVSQQFPQSSASQQQYQTPTNSQQFTQQQFSHSSPSQQSFAQQSSAQQQSYSQQQQQAPAQSQQPYSKQQQPPASQQQQQFLSQQQTQQFPQQPNSQAQFSQGSQPQQQQYCQQSNNVQQFSQQPNTLKEQTQYCQSNSQQQFSQSASTQQQYSQPQYSQQQSTQQQQSYTPQSNVQQKQQYTQQSNAQQQQFSCQSPPQTQFTPQPHVPSQNFSQVSPQQFSQPSPPLPSQQFSQTSPPSQFSQQSPPQKYLRQSPPQQMFPQASPPVQQFSQTSPPQQQFPQSSPPQQLPSPQQQYSQSSPTQQGYPQQFSQHSPSTYTQPSPPQQKYSQLPHQYSQEQSTQQAYQSSQYPQQPSPQQPYSQLPQQSSSQQQYSQQSQQYIHTGQQYPRQASPPQNFPQQTLQKQYPQPNQQQYSHQSVQQQSQYSQQPPTQTPFSQQQQSTSTHTQFSQPSPQSSSQQQFSLPPGQMQPYGASQSQSATQQQFNRQSPISTSPPQFAQQQQVPPQQQFVQQQQQGTSSQPQFSQQSQAPSQHQFNQQSTAPQQQQQFNQQKQTPQSQQQYPQQVPQTSVSQQYTQQNMKSSSSQSYAQPSQSSSSQQYQQQYSQQTSQSSPSPQYSQQHNQGGQTQPFQHFNQQANQQQVNQQTFQQQFSQTQQPSQSPVQPIAQVPATKQQGKGAGRGKQTRGKQVCQVPPPPYGQQTTEKPFPQNFHQHASSQAVLQRQNLQQPIKQSQKRINQHHFQPIIKQEGVTLLPVKQEPNTIPAKCQKAILQPMKQQPPCQALVQSRQQVQPTLIKKQPDCTQMENEQHNGSMVQEVGITPYRDRIDSSISYEWAIPLMKDYVLGVLENSHKMMVLFEIIEETLHVGDKLLVFSQSLSTLDLLEHFLNKEKIPKCSDSSEDTPAEHWCRNKNYFRLDGSTSAQEREKLINEFNNNDKISLFLLSTRAGCLGINLVGANRIVVMDASWNPCHDAQAVCRIYRYGQKKPCHIYRLVTDNSLEKRIYDRQVNKQGMSDRVVDELNPESNFTWKDVTTLIQDDEDDGPSQDLANFESSYTDEVLKYLVTKMSASLSKEPFEHESLLLDRKDLKLTKQEKRMAKQSYEMAKRANMVNIRATYTYLPAGATGTGGQFIINNKQCQWVGGTTIRVLPTQSTSVAAQSSGTGATLRSGTTATPITASPALMSSLFKQGVMVQKLTMPSNISIPVLTPGAPPVVIPAGQDVLVLRTPKGVYLRLPDGRIIAVQLPPSLLAKTQFRPNVVTHFRPAQKGNSQSAAVVNSGGRGQSIGIIKQTLQCGGTVRFIGPRNAAGSTAQNAVRQSAPEVIDLSDDDEPSAKKCSASSSSSLNSADNESGIAEQPQQEPSQDSQTKPSSVPIQQKQITIRRISPASQPSTIQLPNITNKCELPKALQQSQQITIMPINPTSQQQNRSKTVPISQSVCVKPMVLPATTEKRKVIPKNATKIQLPTPLLSAKHLQQNQVTISPAPQFQPQLQQSKLRQAIPPPLQIPSQLIAKPQEPLPVANSAVSQQLHTDLKSPTQPMQSPPVHSDGVQPLPSPQPQLLQSLPMSQQKAPLTQVQHLPRPALKHSQAQLETTQSQSHSSPVLSQHNNQGQLQAPQTTPSSQAGMQLTSQTPNIPLHQPHIPPQQNSLVMTPKMQLHQQSQNSNDHQHSHLTHSYVQQKQPPHPTPVHPAPSSTVSSQPQPPVQPNPTATQPRKRKQPTNRQTSKKSSATQPNVQNNLRPTQPSEITHQFPHSQLPDSHLSDNLFTPFAHHLPSSDFQPFTAFSPHKPVPQIQHPQPLHPLQHNQEHSLPPHLQHMAHLYPLQHISANQPSISDLQPQAPRAWPVPQPPVSSFHPFGQSSPYYNSGHSHESNQFSFPSSFTSSQPPTTSSITQSEQSNVSGIDQPPSICSSEL